MSFTAHVIIFITGIVVILISARSVVKNSLGIAKVFGISDEFIGMTVLSIGTSLPEIVTHIAASFRILREPWLINELSAISIGTNVGSDVFQGCLTQQ